MNEPDKPIGMLLGCPFCENGGQPTIASYPSPFERLLKYSVYCKKCGITQRAFNHQSDAIAEWNKRETK
jgi:Lar family restriction alleviation protein